MVCGKPTIMIESHDWEMIDADIAFAKLYPAMEMLSY